MRSGERFGDTVDSNYVEAETGMDAFLLRSEYEPLQKGSWKPWGGDALVSCPKCGSVQVVLGIQIKEDGEVSFRCGSLGCPYSQKVKLERW